MEVVVATPLDACQDLRHPTIVNATHEQIQNYYKGKIVITERGGSCEPADKTARCERLEAFMHIMILLDSSPSRSTRTIPGESSTDRLMMPTGVVDYSIGYALTRTMLANPNVTVTGTVQTTGPADPAETAALVRLFRAIDATYPGGLAELAPLWFWYEDGTGAQNVFNPIVYLNDSSVVDPCLNRIWNVGCIAGHITYLSIIGQEVDISAIGGFEAFSPFQKLQYLDLAYNPAITGSMPCAWGNMSHLKYLSIGQTGLTSWTECCGGMKSLEMVLAGFNEINNLPPCLSELSNIRIISFDSAKISAPMIDISNWTKLEFLDFNNNHITGTFPNLQAAKHTLQKLLITDNQLHGEIPPNAFDDMPSLLEIDISRNNLSGLLPAFNNTHGLTDLGFAHNNFYGTIPVTWQFPNLLSLRGSHNHLTGSLLPLSTFTSLQAVDLSYNDLYVPPDDKTVPTRARRWDDVIYYLSDCLPASIQTIQLSHNRLNGSWFGMFESQDNLTQVYMSHNLLTSINSDQTFMINLVASKISIYDLSYNPLLTGSLALVGPTPVLQVLKLNGCPLLRDAYSDPPALPQYIITSQDQITKNSADERYSCPALTGRYYPLQISLDPSYYGYTGCVCDQGTYDVPPNCLNIPIKANTTADPISVSVSFTDDVYGSSRMSIGIDTAWAIGNIGVLDKNVTSLKNVTVPMMDSNGTITVNTTQVVNHTELVHVGSTIDRTVAIYITIQLLPLFAEYADIIDIYAGETIQTTPIVSIRGNYPRPISSNYPHVITSSGYASNDTNTVTFVVFASHATVNFRSRQTHGQHFIANATLSSTCPTGWYYDDVITKQCQVIPAILPIYEISSSIATAVWTVAGVVFACIVATILFIIYFRNTVILKASSVPFCLTMLFAAALMAAGSVFYPLSPERGDYVCDARIWFSTLSLVILLAALLTKANRIRDIFNNDDLNKPIQSNQYLMGVLVKIVACEMILLIALTASNMTHSQLTLGSKSTDGYRVYTCTSVESDGYKIWLAFQLTFIAIFLMMGIFIAFGIRNVPSAFNESSSIVNALYLLALLSIILLPINFIVDDNVNALALIRGVGQSLVAFSMTLALFGPKYYYILDGRGNDSKMIETPLSTGDTKRGAGAGTAAGVTPDHDRDRSGKLGHVEIRRGGAPSPAHAYAQAQAQTTGLRNDQLRQLQKQAMQLSQIQEIIKRGGTHQEIQCVLTGTHHELEACASTTGLAMKTEAPNLSKASHDRTPPDLPRATSNSFASLDDIEVNPTLPPSSPSFHSSSSGAVMIHIPNHSDRFSMSMLPQVGSSSRDSVMLATIPQV